MNEITSLHDHIIAHCDDSTARALLAERYPLWQRSCPEMSDTDFVRLGLLRGISAVDSGRHFLQNTKDLHDELIAHSTYFKALKSTRRMKMLEALEIQSHELHCEHMASQGIDYLNQFSELNDYRVEAADGHFIDHAYHTQKGDNGKVYAAGFIYAMNLRNGILRSLCCITNGTQRHQEIPVLRQYIEQHNSLLNQQEKHLYVYDKAVMDYVWWDSQKDHQNYMISVLKENSVATRVEAIPFDSSNPINTGVEGYDIYENKGIRFNVVHYRDPETRKLYRFVTTLPTTINPGTIAMLYYKRWTIEKAYNNSKSDLKEKKAWSSDLNSLNNQMRLTVMSYNMMRIFEETSKIQNPELIHPSDKKYTKALVKRQAVAKKNGRFVNPLFFHKRIVRISSYTIRAVQNAITAKMSLASLRRDLIAQLVPE